MTINGIELSIAQSFVYKGEPRGSGYGDNPTIKVGAPCYELVSANGRYRLTIPATMLGQFDGAA